MLMSNFLRPLYSDLTGAFEKLTSNSASVQEVGFSGSAILIYTFEELQTNCDIILNNVLNPTGILTLSLLNFNAQVAVKSIDFLYCNNVTISNLEPSTITLITDKLINLNGIIKIEGY